MGGEVSEGESFRGKKQIVEEIKEKVDNAQGVVLVDYRGLNVEELTQLRRIYREAGVDYKVYKTP